MPRDSNGDVDLAFAMVASGRYSPKQIVDYCRVSKPTVQRMQERYEELGRPTLDRLPPWHRVRVQTGNMSYGKTVSKVMRSVEQREAALRQGRT